MMCSICANTPEYISMDVYIDLFANSIRYKRTSPLERLRQSRQVKTPCRPDPVYRIEFISFTIRYFYWTKDGKFPDSNFPEFPNSWVPESNRRRDEHASRTPSATHIEHIEGRLHRTIPNPGQKRFHRFQPIRERRSITTIAIQLLHYTQLYAFLKTFLSAIDPRFVYWDIANVKLGLQIQRHIQYSLLSS
jgi:hypothetical protein